MKYGALPLTFTIEDITTEGPELASGQLNAGIIAGIIGLLLVVLYCMLYYRALGLVVISSLVIAGLITYACVLLLGHSYGFTLTLPGIAGLIVAVGITADSFIVYFERLRDEVRDGKTLRTSVETGWKRARNTILAADAVSFLAALVLFIFAIGVVKGFAFALGLTTIIDVFVVFFFTKPVVTLLARTKFFGQGHKLSGLDRQHLGMPPLKPRPGQREGRPDVEARRNRRLPLPGQGSVDFVGQWRKWFAISGVILVRAIGALVSRGLNFGIDFKGGVEYNAQFPAGTDLNAKVTPISDAVVSTGIVNAQTPVVVVSGNKAIRIDVKPLDLNQKTVISNAIKSASGSTEINSTVIGPTWGASIAERALTGLIVFVVLVVLFIWAYFREWRMSVAGIVVALAHDLVITIGIYALTGFEVTPATVTGLLTILGYSLYDTVVVFDKVPS